MPLSRRMIRHAYVPCCKMFRINVRAYAFLKGVVYVFYAHFPSQVGVISSDYQSTLIKVSNVLSTWVHLKQGVRVLQ